MKVLSDATLMSLTKAELIEQLRCAEHNRAEADDRLDQVYENVKDWVPVVRCRDCKWYRASEKLYPNKFCFRLRHPFKNERIGYNFMPDDFCSYGEKNESEDGY